MIPDFHDAQRGISLYCGDALETLQSFNGAIFSWVIDACVTDPPYPEIDRDYGRLTEKEWHALMNPLVGSIRDLLSEKGSAVFVLQPNSERVGRIRPWLWEFMAKWTREWNMPQDAWWWNFAAMPTTHCDREFGLMRPSMKACVWLGPEGCYRNQNAVLLPLSDCALNDSRTDRHDIVYSSSGHHKRISRMLNTCRERGGVTPFNVVVCSNSDSTSNGAGFHGHGAGTPLELTAWWVRYICPEGGTVLDPFMGSGTTGIACIRTGRKFIGIEKSPEHFATAMSRIQRELSQGVLAL